VVAVAGHALVPGVPIEVGLALVAAPSAETFLALALPVELIALFHATAGGVAVAEVAALARRDPPVVRGALVAGEPDHVGATRAATRHVVANLLGRLAAQQTARALPAGTTEGVAPVAGATPAAVLPSGVEQALKAAARLGVAVAWSGKVSVARAVAGAARAPGH